MTDQKPYFTSDKLVEILIGLIEPTSGDVIYDPACGLGTLLIKAEEYITKNSGKPVSKREISDRRVYGREIDIQIHAGATENFQRAKLYEGNLLCENTLLNSENLNNFPTKFDVIVCNAPFHDKAKPEEQANFPVQTNFIELLFLQHAIDHLKEGGRCAIVMPDGVISRTDSTFREIKQRLLDECDLQKIIQLEDDVSPYARIKSSILFFVKGQRTEKTTYSRADNKCFMLQRPDIEARFFDLTPPDDMAENEGEDLLSSKDLNKYRVFISYRRDDTPWATGRLHDYLENELETPVFVDTSSIEVGERFDTAIDNTLKSCDVLIVMIGSKWLKKDKNTQQTRLHQSDDWVRREIILALEREVHVIPVLVDEAKMPRPIQLPIELQELTKRNSIDVTAKRFKDDVKKIAENIKRILYTLH